MADSITRRIPVLLLKTKSAPNDAYEDHFSILQEAQYQPTFVPVLEHRFKKDALHQVQRDIVAGRFAPREQGQTPGYGAIIFTSQRAVEAFTEVVDGLRHKQDGFDLATNLPKTLPLYVVGPATARGLKAIQLQCPILGESTGTGEVLADFILDHYNDLYQDIENPPILFLVGDKRRDIIPRKLQSQTLPSSTSSRVDELVVYETGEMHSFKDEFTTIWQQNDAGGHQWVVVFSPTGCKAMLESLDLLDSSTGKVKPNAKAQGVFVATIGPTTRDFLINEFDFVPDVICDKMVTTRSNDSGSNPDNASVGTKRKEHAVSEQSTHDPKAAKKQITLEETLQTNGGSEPTDDNTRPEHKAEEQSKEEAKERATKGSEEQDHEEKNDNEEEHGDAAPKSGAVEDSADRRKRAPSNILEKGIIYFFTRNRVGVDDAESVGDLQRTFFVMRPLSQGAKLGEGALADSKDNRLFALPKKAFPKSHSDRFMAFVEKSKISIQELKDQFFQGSEYETQTAGTRHNKPVTPVGEGVYLITRTEDRTTHLVYAITIPTELGVVQDDLGLRSEGSFVISVKNPERPGPASARLPQGPEFPKEVIEEFRGLAWAQVKPNYLDYENCQILLIGENTEKATEPTTKDAKQEKITPKEEIDQLEHEDELRVEHLHGNDTVFDDLKISKEEYSKVPTTW
ncbi:tetrapyrrole biosynthesis, uroporphyrinogen III synthase [Aaosphaeria arxii CBS 175.79]|uniref:Tetrapyrrole biosynthesis, uroporphyrinogen III synthase n=1 Tax=Aaosphaeria arxii CBS 175.79 TaxID=1450172 RepID=A0A6A5XHL2_9PLEO|nr:tetrapyrrole biosynthesis, uroporphyrinogen III synthase [Aaosphaeria arxii CBS 175.79]KAF2012369.1 tetrapyrrole biosynthesis, uroporphyrinogen III synthase [Aaosphaeria arxii CBS 175.79]